MAAALRSAGIDCGHERAFSVGFGNPPRMDLDGNWQAESSSYAAPLTPLADTYVVRLVRDPLKVIAKGRQRGGPKLETRRYIVRWLPELRSIREPMMFTALYWVLWNRLVVADETLRLEDIDAETVVRLARLVDPDARRPDVLPQPLNVSRVRPRPVRWADVRDTPGLTEAATEWGYL